MRAHRPAAGRESLTIRTLPAIGLFPRGCISGEYALLAQEGPHLGARTVDARLHRAEVRRRYARGLVIAEALHVHEDKGDALVVGEGLEAALEGSGKLGAER